MYQIVIGLNTHAAPNTTIPITMRGLHGLLFNVLESANPETATWLHHHAAPKPFSMLPYYDDSGRLAGLRYGAITDQCAEVLAHGWQRAQQTEMPLQLGRDYRLNIHTVEVIPCEDFVPLASREPVGDVREQTLDVLSPAAFKQGPGDLPLPLPKNVFGSPFRLWRQYAPEALQLPNNWLDWCEQKVFVTAHQIQTISVPLNNRTMFTGFIGRVTFRATSGSARQLHIWQTLGRFATFCGIGRKTTMGMGGVDKL